ncbi:MAG: fumarylacetoacetate hydrolase family protein, partial [Chloroflexi bacterium]|nr:fumarylacetoacetate hydrolase family protein [Chloroflexota bacterium]
RTPPEWLKPGDVVECEVEGVGTIKNKVTNSG